MASTTSTLPDTRREVYIVMHHVETESAPPPLSPDAINISEPLYTYNTSERACQHAHRYAEERCLLLNFPIKLLEHSEWHDYSGALIGWGWQFIVKGPSGWMVNEMGERKWEEGRVRQRELVWVERQWREG